MSQDKRSPQWEKAVEVVRKFEHGRDCKLPPSEREVLTRLIENALYCEAHR